MGILGYILNPVVFACIVLPLLLGCLLEYALCCKFRHAALRLIPVYIGGGMAGTALLYLLTGFPMLGACGFEGVVLLAVAVCMLLGSGIGRLVFARG